MESQDFDDFRQVLDKQICYTLIFRSLRSLPLPYKYQDLQFFSPFLAFSQISPITQIPSSLDMSNLPSEPEFEQAVEEVTSSLKSFLEKHPEYQKALEIIQIPERVIQFRVVWEGDDGRAQVNRGYRVRKYFSSTVPRVSLITLTSK